MVKITKNFQIHNYPDIKQLHSGGHIRSGHAINQQVSLRNLGKQTIHCEAHFHAIQTLSSNHTSRCYYCITGRLDLYVYIYLCTIYKCHHHFMPYGIVLNLVVGRSVVVVFRLVERGPHTTKHH